jgi:hypothetical protein
MNRYEATNWKAKLAIAAATTAVAVAILESVVSGMLYPNPDTLAARKQTIAAQAEQVEKTRVLQESQVKAAEVRYGQAHLNDCIGRAEGHGLRAATSAAARISLLRPRRHGVFFIGSDAR